RVPCSRLFPFPTHRLRGSASAPSLREISPAPSTSPKVVVFIHVAPWLRGSAVRSSRSLSAKQVGSTMLPAISRKKWDEKGERALERREHGRIGARHDPYVRPLRSG